MKTNDASLWNCSEWDNQDKHVVSRQAKSFMDIVENALLYIVQRHEVLRSWMEFTDDQLFLCVSDNIVISLAFLDAREMDKSEVVQSFVRPFSLTQTPLYRVGVAQVCDESFILLFDIHHIICDALSVDILLRECILKMMQKEDKKLPEKYTDYLSELKVNKTSGENKLYWKNRLVALPVFQIPFVSNIVNKFLPIGNRIKYSLTDKQSTDIMSFCMKNSITPFVFMLGAVAISLRKTTGQSSFCIGTPHSGYLRSKYSSAVGLFTSSLPLIVEITTYEFIIDFFNRIQGRFFEDLSHQNISLKEICELLSYTTPVGRNPLFDIMLVYREVSISNANVAGYEIQPYYDFSNQFTKYDLTFFIEKDNNNIDLILEYSSAAYSEKISQALIRLLVTVCDEIVKIEKGRVCEIRSTMIGLEGKNEKLSNDMPFESLALLLQESFDRYQNEIAVCSGDCNLTYHELNNMGNALARELITYNIGMHDVITIVMRNEVTSIIALIAVIKCGATFLLLEESLPEKRLINIISDACPAFQLFPEKECIVLKKSGESHVISFTLNSLDSLNVITDVYKNTPAYIVYTSGTTGIPKGIRVDQISIVNYLKWAKQTYAGNRCKISMPYFTSVAYDLTFTSLLLPLISGGMVNIYPSKPDTLFHIIKDPRINTLKLTPSHLRMLNTENINANTSSITCIIVGGENFHQELAHDTYLMFGGLYKEVSIYNEYGPAEATIGCIVHKYTHETPSSKYMPIGNPITNMSAYILDCDGYPVLPNIPGELYLSGAGVAHGYINSPELTHNKFIRSSFSDEKIMYSTGDYAFVNDDGILECLGRIDDQIKINGHRVELLEIDNILRLHPDIIDALSIYITNDVVSVITSFFVSNSDSHTSDSLRSFLSESIEPHMLPVYFERIEFIPMTIGGKRDKEKLRVQMEEKLAQMSSENENLEILSTEELIVAEVISDVLSIGIMKRDSNFYLHGGDSIKAILLCAKLRERGYELSVKDIFQLQTVSAMAKRISLIKTQSHAVKKEGYMSLSPIQHWFFTFHRTNHHHYNQSVFISTPQRFNIDALSTAFGYIIKKYEVLQVSFLENNGEFEQYINDPTNCHFEIKSISLRESYGDLKAERELIEKNIKLVQECICLQSAPLVKVCIFVRHDVDSLFITMHHLITDGVSMRIFLNDLMYYYDLICKGNELPIFIHNASYSEWISSFTSGNDNVDSLQYLYKNMGTLMQNLFCGKEPIENMYRDEAVYEIVFDEVELNQIRRRLSGSIHDTLVASLGFALETMFKKKKYCILVETHGRQDAKYLTDISLSLGWFTAISPVDLEFADDIENTIHIRNLGNSPYEYMRYCMLTNWKDFKDSAWEVPEIIFNYMGEYEDTIPWLQAYREPLSDKGTISCEIERHCIIGIESFMQKKRLYVQIRHNPHITPVNTIEAFMQNYKNAITNPPPYMIFNIEETIPVWKSDSMSIEDVEDMKRILGEIL